MLLSSLYGITNNGVKEGYQHLIIHITTTCMIGIMVLMNEYDPNSSVVRNMATTNKYGPIY